MPPISRYACNICDFELPSGWGGIMYVESYEGQRVVCCHPGEYSTVAEVLDIPRDTLWQIQPVLKKPKWWWSKAKKIACQKDYEDACNTYQRNKEIADAAFSRTGFLSDCLCIDCMKIQSLDLEKDKRECGICSSVNIKAVNELLGDVCPKCKEGMIIEIETGFIA